MTPTLSELRSVMEQISFPSDATDFFCRLWERIDEREELRATLLTAEKQYWEAADTATARQTLTDALEASPYSVDLLLLLVCAPRLRAVYAEKGYPDALCVDALRDLTYKLSECLDVYGVYGTPRSPGTKDFTVSVALPWVDCNMTWGPLPLSTSPLCWARSFPPFGCIFPPQAP